MRAAAETARLLTGERVLLQNAVELAPDPASLAPRGPCLFVGREAWIHPDGRFAPCPHPAASQGGLGDFGSVAETPLGAPGRATGSWRSSQVTRITRWQELPAPRPGGA